MRREALSPCFLPISELATMPSRVTFVIATYRRVAALRCTLRSLQMQTNRDWDAIVVGDCCGPETGEMISSLADGRIRYYNFPRRYGEQSGPNTFGLNLATGSYVCFLNHDDLLLADHIEHSLAEMAAVDADFYITLAANAERLEVDTNGATVPICTSVLPAHKELASLISPDEYSFDPSSFWLVRTPYAKIVGGWRHSSTLWRTPLRDWIMRAWRLGGVFSFGTMITGIRFWTQNLRLGAPHYENETPEHEYMIKRMENSTPGDIRKFIHDQLKGDAQSAGSQIKVPIPGRTSLSRGREEGATHHMRLNKAKKVLQAELYMRFGFDYWKLACYLTGREKGALHRALLHKRTAESLSEVMDISHLLRDPESLRFPATLI